MTLEIGKSDVDIKIYELKYTPSQNFCNLEENIFFLLRLTKIENFLDVEILF